MLKHYLTIALLVIAGIGLTACGGSDPVRGAGDGSCSTQGHERGADGKCGPPTTSENEEEESEEEETAKTPVEILGEGQTAVADAEAAAAKLKAALSTVNAGVVVPAEYEKILAARTMIVALQAAAGDNAVVQTALTGHLTTIDGLINEHRAAYNGSTLADPAADHSKDRLAQDKVPAVLTKDLNDRIKAALKTSGAVMHADDSIDQDGDSTTAAVDPDGSGSNDKPGVTHDRNPSNVFDTGRGSLWTGNVAYDALPSTITKNAALFGRKGMTWDEFLGTPVPRQVDNLPSNTLADDDSTQLVWTVPFVKSAIVLPSGTNPVPQAVRTVSGNQRLVAKYSIRGVEGAIYCQAGPCGSQHPDADGDGTSTPEEMKTLVLTGSLFFVPTSPGDQPTGPSGDFKLRKTYLDPDEDGVWTPEILYAQYGYWITADDGLRTFAVPYTEGPPIADGDLDLSSRQSGGRRASNYDGDKASYAGEALGLYVWGDEAGEFEAQVDLEAKFGTSPTIGGHIKDFKNSTTGNTVGNAWSVTLGSTSIDPDGTVTGGTTTTSSGGFGEGEHPGRWQGQMYGKNADDNEGGQLTTATADRPEGITGQFNAKFHGGDDYAAGAFGAER